MEESQSTIKVICIETEAFYALIQEVVTRMIEEQNSKHPKWISTTDAMEMLGIKSKATIQKLKNNGSIRFSPISRKVVLFDRQSILEFLEKKARNTF